MEVSNDNNKMDALNKIEKAKELLDMGAITQEEFEAIKSKYLKEVCEINIDSQDDQQSKNADFIGEALANAMGNQQTSDSIIKKSEQQKMAERASSQAANTVAREVTKEIMRGLFKDMK